MKRIYRTRSNTDSVSQQPLKLCACGCGKPTTSAKYVLGHNRRGDIEHPAGAVYVWLTVTATFPRRIRKHTYWECVCRCGTVLWVRSSHVKDGRSTSCGCRAASKCKERSLTHGMTGTATYSSWLSMKDRCLNSKSASYAQYGGRGITIHKPWLDFAVFLEDMGERPSGTTIDRIDNALGYSPGNCRWATPTQQVRNRGVACVVRYRGKDVKLADLAETTALTLSTLYQRIYRYGWSVGKAVRTPSRQTPH